jgi:hypothetical protein
MAKKASNEVLIGLYEKYGNVWTVADEVGMCGQSVHERLTRLGVINKMNVFTDADKERIRNEYSLFKKQGRLEDLAKSLGRTKQFICRQAKVMGLTGNKGPHLYARKEDANPYSRYHANVRSIKGCPHKCEVCGEDSPRKWYEWANLTGNYDDPNDYKRMCRVCHRKHDKNRVMLAHK